MSKKADISNFFLTIQKISIIIYKENQAKRRALQVEYGSDYFDKDGKLLPQGDEASASLNSDEENPDYADKTAEDSPSGEDRYDEIFDTTKRNTRVFSVVSLILAAVSLLCSFVGPLGFILGILSVAAALVSRRVLGYFDGIGVAGLVLGIFALAFGAAVFVLGLFTDVLDAIKNLL